MALIITDKNLGIEVKNATVKIGYLTINRAGFFEKTGLPKFSANLYLEYSSEGEIYFRKCISIDGLSMEELTLETMYTRIKELEEFKSSEDSIPVYVAPEVVEEVVVVEEKVEE